MICQKFWKRVKIRPSRAKKRPFFGHSPIFSDLEICPANEFFCFFNMVFLSMFRSYLQKIVTKKVKIFLWRTKNYLFWLFLQFFWHVIFSSEWIFWFSLWCFWAHLEGIYKKLWKKDQILKGWKSHMIFKIIQKLA